MLTAVALASCGRVAEPTASAANPSAESIVAVCQDVDRWASGAKSTASSVINERVLSEEAKAVLARASRDGVRLAARSTDRDLTTAINDAVKALDELAASRAYDMDLILPAGTAGMRVEDVESRCTVLLANSDLPPSASP